MQQQHQKNSTRLRNIILVLLSAIVVSLMILKLQWLVIIFLLVGIYCVVVIRKPMWGILSILVVTSSIFEEGTLPVINIGIGNFHIVDLVLLFLLFLIIIKMMLGQNTKLNHSPLDWFLVTFWLAACVALFIAVFRFGVTMKNALSELRIITFYMVFFLVTNLINSKNDLKLLIRGAIVLASAVAVFMLVQSILGESFTLVSARIESLSTAGVVHDSVIRVITPGTNLIFIMLIISFSILIISQIKKQQLFLFINIIALTIGIILSYNRNNWVAILLMVLILFFIVPAFGRIKIVYGFIGVLFVALLIIIWSGINNGRLSEYLDSTAERFTSLFQGNDLYEKDTLLDRKIENEFAFDKIRSHPIFGIGLGNSYRPFEEWNPKINLYIHNGYWWILMKTGFLGFIPFLIIGINFFFRGFLMWHKIADEFLRGMAIGNTLAFLAICISATVAPVFMQWQTTPVIGMIWGCNELIYKFNDSENENTIL
jgi:O-antigen ligase